MYKYQSKCYYSLSILFIDSAADDPATVPDGHSFRH